MTFTLNGFGTTLAGDRWLNELEWYHLINQKGFLKTIKKLPIHSEEEKYRFRIATKAVCIAFIPVLPLETFIYYSPKTSWYENDRYVPVYYTVGEGKIDWNHVKKSWSFYIAPVLFLIIILLMIFFRI